MPTKWVKEKGNIFRLRDGVDSHHDTIKLRWACWRPRQGQGRRRGDSIGFDFLVWAATAASVPATSSLKLIGVFLQLFERDDSAPRAWPEHDLRGAASRASSSAAHRHQVAA